MEERLRSDGASLSDGDLREEDGGVCSCEVDGESDEVEEGLCEVECSVGVCNTLTSFSPSPSILLF